MSKQKRLASILSLLLKGIGIGAANTVPGVSGGTIAAITGIYDSLIHAISTFFKAWKKNTLVLAPVGAGALLGIALFASLVEYLLATAPQATAFFFIGLIVGSLPFLFGQVSGHRAGAPQLVAAALAAGVVVVMGVAGRPPMSEPITTLSVTNGLWLLLAGAIAAATMIIPGVSGSFVLLLIGMYQTFIAAVSSGNLPLLSVLGVGALLGIVAVSRLLDILFAKFYAATYWAIIGLVAGSVVGIWPGVAGEEPMWLSLLAVVAGFGLAFGLGSRKPAVPEGEHEQQEV
jgi:putative membrane protein